MDKAEQVAELFLSLAEALHGVGPCGEVVAQAAQSTQEAAVSQQGLTDLIESKRCLENPMGLMALVNGHDQQVLFSAPMTKARKTLQLQKRVSSPLSTGA